MFILTMKAIRTNFAINIFTLIINASIFSVMLLLYGWIDEMYYSSASNTFVFLKVIVSLFVLVIMFSMYYITKFMLNKRKKEFRSYLICGATYNFVYICELLHVLTVVLFSEFLGTAFFMCLKELLRVTVSMNTLSYVYIVFVLLYLAETTIIHFLNIKEISAK